MGAQHAKKICRGGDARMIAPEKVRARAAEKEDENLAFRRYLKNHAD